MKNIDKQLKEFGERFYGGCSDSECGIIHDHSKYSIDPWLREALITIQKETAKEMVKEIAKEKFWTDDEGGGFEVLHENVAELAYHKITGEVYEN